MNRIKIQVKGRVQGVFYRKTTCDTARSLGICGWVANTSTGDVVIEATGDADKLAKLVSWCWQGPENARVDDVHVESLPYFEGKNGFEIRKDVE